MNSLRFPVLALSLLVAAASAAPQVAQTLAAACDLQAAAGSTVGGKVELLQDHPGGPVRVSGLVHGLGAGLHGFHLHQEGKLDDNCKAAGPHFNPLKVSHGAPTDNQQHAGDFGNIVASDQGVSTVDFATSQISLEVNAINGAIGRAIVVHALPDDLGRGNTEESTKTGSAGARVACCVITQAYYA
ncbi:superoxide dismutase [Cu-Zn]-like [Frankliniella occidentalis]|uniref:Superoxide dismutase [Cu-Zn]-like n=1 Tax=Frankliniella occidentalis TaxID=133901 RepID=A0A6J1T4V3_FRAOC|nr:superoxide dismutase [Cu-Zn]-like [Frankliniella occidentalis]